MNEQEFQNLYQQGKAALGLTWGEIAVRLEEVEGQGWRLYFYEEIDGEPQLETEEVWESWPT